jgi:hypothetical protein
MIIPTQEIWHKDCRDFSWPSSDCLMTDPAYSKHVHQSAVSHSPVRGARPRDLGFDHLTPELMNWTCTQASMVSRWVCIFSDIESVGAWAKGLEAAGAHYIRAIPWVRWSMPQLSGDRPPQGSEMIVIGYGYGKGRKHWNGPGNLTHFDHKCLRGETKHKAEKPLDLCLSLIQWFSDEGDRIMDPFAGAGTIGLASKILYRDYVGTEVDPVWAAYSQQRLASYPDLTPRDTGRYNRWKQRQLLNS